MDFTHRGEYREAKNTIVRYEEVLQLLNIPKSDPLWGALLSQRIIAGNDLWETVKVEELDELVAQAHQPGWEKILPLMLIRQAELNLRTGRFEIGKKQMDVLLGMDLELKNRFSCLVDLAVWTFSQGLLNDSIKHLKEAEMLIPQIPDNLELERRLSGTLTFPLIVNGDLDSAERYAKRAIELATLLGNRSSEGTNWAQIGKIVMARGNLDAAAIAKKRAIFLFKSTGGKNVCFSQFGLAQIYLEQRKYKLALLEFQNAYRHEDYEVWYRLGESTAWAGLQRWQEMLEELDLVDQRVPELACVDFELIELTDIGIRVCRDAGQKTAQIRFHQMKSKFCEKLNLVDEMKKNDEILSSLV